jgi:hypothetical protein
VSRHSSFLPAGNIDEIAADPALRIYGALLAVTHVLTFLVWRKIDVARILSSKQALCWPFWEDCRNFRVFSQEQIEALLWLYLALALGTAALFSIRRCTRLAWWAFLLLTLLKLLVVAEDFQLRLNQHYMIAFVSLTFLFFPEKRSLLRLLIAFFYFWAGILKLDREWLSGAALYADPWLIHGQLLPYACTYVVVLELLLVWGLFSRRVWLFGLTLGQLILFHVVSFNVVGFFYPSVMFCLLAIFVLVRRSPAPMSASNPIVELFRGGAHGGSYALLVFFGSLQILPALFPGDSALTGEGRWLALHMFDAKVECEAYAELKRPDGATKRIELRLNLSRRIRCDPLVTFDRARALCALRRPGQGYGDFDLFLNSRRSTELQMHPIIRLENFCAADPHYDVWRHNAWIGPQEGR